jgi:hypothetical protein
MKILFTRNETFANEYLADSVYHGLVSSGHTVIDVPELWYMYKDGRPGTGQFKSHTELHGRGFTMYRLVDNDDDIDRTDVEEKIRSQYYDLCILARADFGSPYEQLILEHYPDSKIIILDGRDQQNLIHYRDSTHLADRGTYFKRELPFRDQRILPISFAFPKEKIIHPSGIVKENLIAGAKPVFKDADGKAHYSFDNELDYYKEYARSYFGETQAKGGWDCMRHYEIMAAGCVPIFHGIENCPDTICTTLPKEELLAVNGLIAEHGIEWFLTAEGQVVYAELQSRIFEHFVTNCTTEALGRYVLETHAKRFE